MIKRHPVKSIILAVVIVIAITLSVAALIGAAAKGQRNDSVSGQLSMGIHYLEESSDIGVWLPVKKSSGTEDCGEKDFQET